MSEFEDEKGERKSKRQKTSYKEKAFERFKQLKSGNRNKYEVEEMESVYETVDEKEYTKRVLERQEDDWIVDDDGSGYVEDGRDIFDDDMDPHSLNAASTSKSKSSKKKKSLSKAAVKGNLQYMLSNLPSKKKEEEKLADDSALSEILGEIDENPSVNTIIKPKPMIQGLKKLVINQAEKSYMQRLSSPTIKPLTTQTKVKPLPTVKRARSPSPDIPKENQEQVTQIEEMTKVQPDEIKAQSPALYDTQEDLFGDDLDFSQINDSDLIEDSVNEKLEKVWVNIEEKMESEWVQQDEDAEEKTFFEEPSGDKSDGKDGFKFFWFDAYEDQYKQPGVVLLFGKTFDKSLKKYVSCCVIVRNIERKLYFLPRKTEKGSDKPVTPQDVYQEINKTVMKSINVKQFKARPIVKKYAFDRQVPAESDYIEVRYSAKDKAIPSDMEGSTFSRVFGSNSSYLEILLLDRKIKGPCWLNVVDPVVEANPVSWCHVDVTCSKTANLQIVQDFTTEKPPLVVAAVNMRIVVNHKTCTNEIVMMSCCINTAYSIGKQVPVPFQKHFCVLTNPKDTVLPADIFTALKSYKATTVQKMDSEKALLNYFINQWNKLDVDVVVGHDLQGYQITVLAERLAHYNNTNFSKFSRLKRSTFDKRKMERELFLGRLVCDIKISSKELLSCRTYDLDNLCQTVLKMGEGERVDLEAEDIVRMYRDSSNIIKLISATMQDTANILKIMYNLNIIPLAMQITNIAGNVMSRTLLGGRSERNEFLLLHAFAEKDFIVPDKVYSKRDMKGKGEKAKKEASYSGGLVLEPKVGLYDHLVLLMDFNSLYPSIIQEYNICFTTISPEMTEENLILPDKSLPYGILPNEIKKLVESRREVKKLMNNPDLPAELKMQYHIRQMALKLTANSMYGCLGFAHSRFFEKNLAALITYKGREILTNTKDLVEHMRLQVIYGDTDSLMINTQITDYDQVFKIGREIKQEVNKHYRQVELDIDGVFKHLLLLKKKKYAAVVLSKDKDGKLRTETEYKGLDIVRRDWSKLASETGKIILNHIFTDLEPEERLANIVDYLKKIRNELNTNQVPMSLLLITKQLNKNPNMYPDPKGQPHVMAALRYNKESGGHFRAGDTVSYVICDDGSKNAHMQRAYLLEELHKPSSKLKIDVSYYLSQQIFPVVTRICQPIEYLDPHLIAEALGVDAKQFRISKPGGDGANNVENMINPDAKYRNCKPFVFKCAICKCENEVKGVLNSNNVPWMEKCSNAECSGKPVGYFESVQNQLVLEINRCVKQYYEYTMCCEDPTCLNETTRLPLATHNGQPLCMRCKMSSLLKKYSESDLYNQLMYFRFIFDVRNVKKLIMEQRTLKAYSSLKDLVQRKLDVCGYSLVDLGELFGKFLRIMPQKRIGKLGSHVELEE